VIDLIEGVHGYGSSRVLINCRREGKADLSICDVILR